MRRAVPASQTSSSSATIPLDDLKVPDYMRRDFISRCTGKAKRVGVGTATFTKLLAYYSTETKNKLLKNLVMKFETAWKHSTKKKKGKQEVELKFHNYAPANRRDGEDAYIGMAQSWEEYETIRVNGVRFDSHSRFKFDNSCCMVKFKVAGREQIAYGIIQKIIAFLLGREGEKMVFMIKWLKSHGICDHTNLQKIGGLHEEWNEVYPFQDGSNLCAGNVNFWAMDPFEDNLIGVETTSARYLAIESKVHSH